MSAPIFLIENPKCVFIHIPKTGGTSIRKGVFNLEHPCGAEWENVPAAWKKCFKFAFVRNPYDRLVSGWKYFKGEENFSFNDFVQIITGHKIHRDMMATRRPKEGQGLMLTLNGGATESIHHHLMPQLHPYNHLKHADFIGRFENLQEDFDKICDQLNAPRQKVPHFNKTNHKHYSSYYNKSIKMMADQYYEEDLQKLGYHFNKEWL